MTGAIPITADVRKRLQLVGDLERAKTAGFELRGADLDLVTRAAAKFREEVEEIAQAARQQKEHADAP